MGTKCLSVFRKIGVPQSLFGSKWWIKDSGCSRHMTGNISLFSTYHKCDWGNVTFGSKAKSKITGKGTISHDSLSIDDVAHVDNLGFNLLSISQLSVISIMSFLVKMEVKYLKMTLPLPKVFLRTMCMTCRWIIHLETNFVLLH